MVFRTLLEILLRWLEFAPIVVGLVFTMVELRHVQEAQKLSNQLKITEQHRDIWSQLFEHREFERILEQNVNLKTNPVTNQESLFVTFLLLHLKTSFRAERANMLDPAKALCRDIRWFLSLPIPNEVWIHSKKFQDDDFSSFVEESLNGS
jgi:hypothetical protein